MTPLFPIDHVTVAGRVLAPMQQSLDIPTNYGGPHANGATEMALTGFADGSYLELIAIQSQADPTAVAAHDWRRFLESDGGPCAWAIRPADFTSEIDRLRQAGIHITGPHKNGRKRPDGVQLEWETAQIGPTNGGFFPFMIHDFTPRDQRVSAPANTNITGVVKVLIAVRDIGAAVAQYREAYGLPMPELQDDRPFGARLAWFPGTPVILAAPLGPDSWLKARLQQFGEAPCAFVLGVKTFASNTTPSKWFGDWIFWKPQLREKLSWHLGSVVIGHKFQ